MTGPVQGQMMPTSGGSDFNLISFICEQIVNRVNTASLVKVIAVHGGGLDPVGTVDVQPMVNQVDGAGNGTPHGIIYGLPYIRIQGGACAIIIDPAVGDIGQAIFCSNDISTVKVTGEISNPASGGKFSMADGIYLGGTLNEAPTQYVWLMPNGGGIQIVGETYLTDSLNVTGDVFVGTGASGSFTTPQGQTVTVQDGIVTNIY